MFQNDLYNLFVFIGVIIPVIIMVIILFVSALKYDTKTAKDIRYIKSMLDKAKDEIDVTFDKVDK